MDRIARNCSAQADGPVWAVDPWALCRDALLNTNERIVLLALCRCANDNGEVTGGGWLSHWTHLHRNTITSVTKRLERKGVLLVTRSTKRPNRYRLSPYPPWGRSCTSLVRGEGGGASEELA